MKADELEVMTKSSSVETRTHFLLLY